MDLVVVVVVVVVICVCLSYCHACSLQPFGHLLGKG